MTPMIWALFFVALALTVWAAPWAAYRLSVLVAEDDGPGHRIAEWRASLEARGRIALNEDGTWCGSCASIWAAGAVVALGLVPPAWPVVWWLGLAGYARREWMKESA